MSVEVPPMSKVTTFSRPPSLASSTPETTPAAGDDAGRRTRQQRLVGKSGAQVDPHQSAVGLHQEELRCRDPGVGEPVRDPQQIRFHDRADMGVDHGRRQPGIFADRRKDARRQRNSPMGRCLGENASRPLLVIAIEETEQEAYRDRFDIVFQKPLGGAPDVVLVERLDDLALVVEPLAHLVGETLRRQQRRLHVERIQQVIRVRLRPTARLVDGAKAPGNQQTGLDTLALDQRVGRDRRAVDQKSNIGRIDAAGKEFVEGADHRLRRIRRNGGNLGDAALAAFGIERDQIGERATGVDTHHP
jgi:hypothetical protein